MPDVGIGGKLGNVHDAGNGLDKVPALFHVQNGTGKVAVLELFGQLILRQIQEGQAWHLRSGQTEGFHVRKCQRQYSC